MRAGLLTHATKGRVALALAGLAVAGALLLGGASPGTAAPSSGIVVNEVYGGGGNSGATLHQRLHRAAQPRHRGRERRRLVGAVPRGDRDGRWQATQLTGSIPAGGIYLVAEAAGTGGTTPCRRQTPPAPSRWARTAGTVAARQRRRRADVPGLGGLPERRGRPRRLRHRGHQRDGPDPRRLEPPPRCSARTPPTPTTTPTTSPPARRPRTAANAGGGGDTGDGEPGPLASTTSRTRRWLAAHNGETGHQRARHRHRHPHRPAAAAASGSRTPIPTRARPPARASSSSPAPSPGVTVGDSVLVSGTVSDFYPLSSGDTVAAPRTCR